MNFLYQNIISFAVFALSVDYEEFCNISDKKLDDVQVFEKVILSSKRYFGKLYYINGIELVGFEEKPTLIFIQTLQSAYSGYKSHL